MIIDKKVTFKVGARNLPKVRNVFPETKKGDSITLNQQDAVKLFSKQLFDCRCDKCGKDYQQSGYRLSQNPNRQFYCGDCILETAAIQMKVTKRTTEFRESQSKKWKEIYSTSKGKEIKKKQVEGWKQTFQEKPELSDIWTKNLKIRSGTNHPRWNPNTTEFKRYAYQVRKITEENYAKHSQIINPYSLPRTLCGVEGGYQLDHRISIHKGFKFGISPKVIGSVDNLQMMTWKDNRTKHK